MWSERTQSTPVTAKLPNLISFVCRGPLTLQLSKIHSFLCEQREGERTACVVENNKVWLCPLAQQRSHFPIPVGVFCQKKERQRKGGKNHWVLFRKVSDCSDSTALKEEEKERIVPW